MEKRRGLSERSEFRSRPDAALRTKEQVAAGCRLLWLLSFGQAKESNLMSGNPDNYQTVLLFSVVAIT